MNKKSIIFTGAALLAGLILGRLSVSSPKASEEAHDHALSPSTWTCSMHPQIHQPEPGNCPICGMALIPLEANSGSDNEPRTLTMSESARALAEIETTTAIRDFPEAEIRMVGKLDYDETREKSLTARFPARIDQLFVNYTGIPVKEGEHLASVYSPDLLTAQRELLTAYRSNPESSITQVAREKLRLWGLLPDQIEEILHRGEAQDHFTLRAPIGGLVVAKQVNEGSYIETGQPLFKIVDLSQLWLYLEAYESDLTSLRYGQEVTFQVETFPGESFFGTIAFIEPEVDRKTRTVSVRVNVDNADGRLKPGMFARGVVTAKMGDGGYVYAPNFAGKWISPMHPEIVKDGPGQCDICGMDLVPAEKLGYIQDPNTSAPIIIPASSVLKTGKRAIVYVKKPHTDQPAYEGREIEIGPRAGDFYIVHAGLKAGEEVVTQGAFKIDSALQIQAQPSMMNPLEEKPALEITAEIVTQILPAYFALQVALTEDNLEDAQSALTTIMAQTGHAGALPKLLHQMLDAQSLDTLRKPHFDTLSSALITALKENPQLDQHDLYIMHCPMVYGDHGADWLQNNRQLRNPYFGSAMLTCGEVKETLGEPESNDLNVK